MVGTVEQAVYAMGLNAGDYVRESQRVAQSNESLLQSTEQVAVAEEKLQRATRLSSEAFARHEARLEPMIRLERERAKALETAQKYLEAGTISQERHAAQVDRIAQAYDRQAASLQRAAAETQRLAQAEAAQRAQAAQNSFNTVLGVRSDFGGAQRQADFEAAARAADRLRAAHIPLAAAQQDYIRNLREVRAAESAGVLSTNEAAAAIQRHKAAFADAVRGINSAGGSFGGIRSMGAAVQQAGYQIGDFAVQVASGQGVLRPFIQQGTQLVSMFGHWGAAIGAAGAVIGALAVSFMDAGKTAEQAKKELDDYNEAVEKYVELAGNAEEKAKARRTGQIEDIKLKIADRIATLDLNAAEIRRQQDIDRAQRKDPRVAGYVQAGQMAAEDPDLKRRLDSSVDEAKRAQDEFNKLIVLQQNDQIVAWLDKRNEKEKEYTDIQKGQIDLATDRARQDTSRTRSLEQYIKGLEDAARLDGLTESDKKVQNALIQAQNKLIDETGDLTRKLHPEEEKRIVAAVKLAEAHERTRKSIKDELAALNDWIDNQLEMYRGQGEATKADTERSRALSAANDNLDEYLRKLEGRATLDAENSTEKKVQEALIEAQNKLIDQQNNKLRDLTEEERNRITLAVRQADAYEKQRAEAKKFQVEIDRTAERVKDRLADNLGDTLFDYMEGRAGSFWETFVTMGKRAAAQLAAQAFTQAVFAAPIRYAVSSLPSFFGISSPAGSIGGLPAASSSSGMGFGNVSLPSFNNMSFAALDSWGAGTGIFSGLGTPAMTAANQAALTEAAALGGSGAPISSSGMLPFSASQAFAGIGTALSAYSFAKNPNVGSGLSLAGSGAALLSSLGYIAPAFGPIGMGVAAVGAVLSAILSKRSKQRGSWGTGAYQTSVEDQLLASGALGTSNTPSGLIKTTWFGEDGTPTAAGYYSSGLYGDSAEQAMLIQRELGRSSRSLAGRYGVSLAGQNIGNYIDQTRGSILTALTNGGSDEFGKVWQRNLSAFDYEFDQEGSFENALARAQLVMLARSSGGNANVRSAAQMLSREQVANPTGLDAEEISKLLGFAENFDLITQSVSGGRVDYSQAAGIQARAAAQQTFASIQDLIDTAARLGQDTQAATEAGKSAVEIMLGLKDAAPQMSAAEQAMAQLTATFENAGQYLEFIGRDASEAAGLLQQAQQKLASAANDNYDALSLALSNPYLAAQQALDKERQQAIADADTLGADRNKVIQYYNLRALELEKQYLGDRNAALQEANDSIAAYLAGNAINDPSLTAAQRLAAAQQQFDTALTSARGGDSEARSSLSGLADAVLKAGAAQYDTATPEYATLRQMIRSTLGQLAGIDGYADGTASAPGGWAMVGEEGPELAYIPRGTAVLPADISARLLNGGGGGDLAPLVENLIAVTRLQAAEIAAMNKKLDRLAVAFERQTDAATQARMRRSVG